MYDALDRRWFNAKATVSLAAANVLIYGADIASGHSIREAGKLVVDAVTVSGEYYRLVSSSFLHADIRHLLSNMLILIYIGAVVERNIKPLKFLLLYFICELMGNIATIAYEIAAGENWTSLGASGAVFGVLGAMLVLVIKGRGSIKRSGSSLLRRLAFVIVYSLLAGFSSEGVNNIAHVAGFITGVLLCAALSFRARNINLEALL